MKRACDPPIKGFSFAAMTLLFGCAMTQPSTQQQEQKSIDAASSSDFNYLNRGLVEDWSSRHVVFSNPGTLEDAIRNGKREEWERIVSDPRYRMQWVRRYGASASAGLTADAADVLQAPSKVELPVGVFQKKWNKKEGFRSAAIHGDWTVQLGASTASVAIGKYPAKYTFAPIGTPSCTADFVVFPVNAAGNSTQQANLIGVNNLYSGMCTGTVPTVKFAYFVGTGKVQTSPTLALDGTKIAFVETVTNGSIFHVLTIGTTGSNGTAFNSVVTPCTINGVRSCTTNNAVDTKITMSGGVTDTSSGPFVDYDNDVAYVGDDNGGIHKFTGVFKGTLTEAGSPWPVASAVSASSAPVYDSVSQHIIFGTGNGNIRCIVAATAADCGNGAVSVAGGIAGTITTVADSPIVDSTNKTVFAAASNNTNSVLFQADTTLSTASQVRVTMGANGTDLYDGTFDNAYFTTVNTGHMYFCGNLTGAATPTLYRVGFSSTGKMNATKDAGSIQLVQNNQTGTAKDCTPLTEVLNGSTDILFVGVKDNGLPTGCNGNTCIMSFDIGSAFPVPIAATTTNNLGAAGMSGFIIDNVSGTAGASQIYYGSLQTSVGVQASQSTLQ